MEPAVSSGSSHAPTTPLALPPVLARIVAHLDERSRKRFRALGTLVQEVQQSKVQNAAPGCHFIPRQRVPGSSQ